MADYTLEGNYLRNRSGSTIAELESNRVRDTASMSYVGEFDDKYIRDRMGNIVAELDGNDIFDRMRNRIGSISDVRNIIDGPGGVSLVALWVLCIR